DAKCPLRPTRPAPSSDAVAVRRLLRRDPGPAAPPRSPPRDGPPSGTSTMGPGPAPRPARGPPRLGGGAVRGPARGRGAGIQSGVSTRIPFGPVIFVFGGCCSIGPAGATTPGRNGTFMTGAG